MLVVESMPMPISVVDVSKSFRRSCFRFGGFDFAISRRRVRYQRFQQMMRGVRDFIDGAIESLFVCFRRFSKSGQLPNKLQRRRANLIICRRR